MRIHHLNCGSLKPYWPRLEAIVYCLLVETNQGLLLVDTGFGLQDYSHPTPTMRLFTRLLRVPCDERETAVRQVVRLGYDAEDVRHIVMTHLHLDHAGGLRDLSISRTSFDWGIPVPGDPAHVMYVWVDALTNYLTGVGYPDTACDLYQRYWPADLHMIGKDIIRFHTVYWPAFLMSAGISLPRRVFAHGFLYNRGEKMSKSIGNVVDPVSLVQTFGVDQVRYFLLREVPFGQDGSYSEDAIIGRINADLANEFGNLAQRSLSMVAKNLDGIVPEPGEFSTDDLELLELAWGLLPRLREAFDEQAMHQGLEAIWLMLGAANRYFSAQEPWALRKSESAGDQVRFRTVLYVTLEAVRVAALLVAPVMPASADRLLDLLGQPSDRRDFAALGTRLTPGTALPAPAGVFPRHEATPDC